MLCARHEQTHFCANQVICINGVTSELSGQQWCLKCTSDQLHTPRSSGSTGIQSSFRPKTVIGSSHAACSFARFSSGHQHAVQAHFKSGAVAANTYNLHGILCLQVLANWQPRLRACAAQIELISRVKLGPNRKLRRDSQHIPCKSAGEAGSSASALSTDALRVAVHRVHCAAAPASAKASVTATAADSVSAGHQTHPSQPQRRTVLAVQ
jgi:hypothetical protein